MTALVSFPKHKISILVGTMQIFGWQTYEITQRMTEPDSHFSMRLPFDLDAWTACAPDTPVQVLIDTTPVLNGRIDDRLLTTDENGADCFDINGRNNGARLVDESAPSLSFAGLDMFSLINQLVSPWFPKGATFSNARNRNIIRGRGKKAQAAGEPVKIFTKKNIGWQLQPGMTRWSAIQGMAAQAGYLAWPSGDGLELIVGEPNYDQEIQFGFFQAKADTTREDEVNVNHLDIRDSVAERYSMVVCVGSGVGTDANYGATVASRYAEVKNNPATTDGVGLDFQARKVLVIVRQVQSQQEALELATREMAKRDYHKETVTLSAPGHGQLIAGAYVTIFGPDMLARVEDERIGRVGTYLITDCVYRCTRSEGETTDMTLIPSGTLMVAEA